MNVNSSIDSAKRRFPPKPVNCYITMRESSLLYAMKPRLRWLSFMEESKGRLVIGGSTIPGGYFLPKCIGAFTTVYPEVTISLIIGDTDQIIQDVLSGSPEFGIVGAKTSNKNIRQEKLLEDEMRLIVTCDHKWAEKKHISPDLMFKEPFIVRERGSGTLKSIKLSLKEKGYTSENLNIIAELGSTEAVIQGIKNKVGVSILSTIAVAEELKAGTLKALTIKELNLKRSFYLITHKHRSPSPLCNAFINFLKKEFANV